MTETAHATRKHPPSREEVCRVAVDASREGIPGFIRGVFAAAPAADVVEAAGDRIEFDIPADVAIAYNQAGSLRVPQGSKCLAYLMLSEEGRERVETASAVDVAILDPGGNVDEPSLLALAAVLEVGDQLLTDEAIAQRRATMATPLH